jgi:hypothetical protein
MVRQLLNASSYAHRCPVTVHPSIIQEHCHESENTDQSRPERFAALIAFPSADAVNAATAEFDLVVRPGSLPPIQKVAIRRTYSQF